MSMTTRVCHGKLSTPPFIDWNTLLKRGITNANTNNSTVSAMNEIIAGYASAPFTRDLMLSLFSRKPARRLRISSCTPPASPARTMFV